MKRKTRPSTYGSAAGSSGSKRSRRPPGDAGTIADKYAPPSSCLADLGGIASSIEKILELIAMPLCHPEIYMHTGVKPPRGVLLHGPPGCGKTMLAGAVAGDFGLPFLSISAPSIVSGTSGESEATLRQTFEEAARIAPAILFIDEIDAITPKRETAGREMERRIVAQLLTCLDDLSWDKTGGKPVMVIGATNRPDAIDPALRRAGRFDHEIALGVPDEEGREQILRVLAKKLRLSGDFDFKALAKSTPGYVGADLTALTSQAGIIAVKRIFNELGQQTEQQRVALQELIIRDGAEREVTAAAADVDMKMDEDVAAAASEGDKTQDTSAVATEQNGEASAESKVPTAGATDSTEATPTGRTPSNRFFSSLPPALAQSSIASFLLSHPAALTSVELEPLSITNDDFLVALPSIQPSSKREGFATVPDVSWADVGALHSTREELCMAIVEPIKRPELFAAVGVKASSGVLLWGPPGCGKTLLAKAVANESRANFISVKGPELLNKYVGESERAVRQVFSRARTSSPCVIFFDELDALVPRRDEALSESSSRVVNTLLTELDGLESRGQVYVIGATNRPDMIDPAMCRPGRLDKLCYVDLPNQEERWEILKTLTKKSPLGDAVDLQLLAQDAHTRGFSGADLYALVRESATVALQAALRHQRAEEAKMGTPPLDGQASAKKPSALPKVSITQTDFTNALQKVRPSVSKDQREKYASLRETLSGGGSDHMDSVGGRAGGARRTRMNRIRGGGAGGSNGGASGGVEDAPGAGGDGASRPENCNEGPALA